MSGFWGASHSPPFVKFFLKLREKRHADCDAKGTTDQKIDFEGSALVTRGNEQQGNRRGSNQRTIGCDVCKNQTTLEKPVGKSMGSLRIGRKSMNIDQQGILMHSRPKQLIRSSNHPRNRLLLLRTDAATVQNVSVPILRKIGSFLFPSSVT